MKKIVAGIGFELTGALMMVLSSFSASMAMEHTTAWSTKLGQYWQTVANMGLFPIFIGGAILLITGIVFSLWGVFSKNDQ